MTDFICGRGVLVTGASGGIGGATVRQLGTRRRIASGREAAIAPSRKRPAAARWPSI